MLMTMKNCDLQKKFLGGMSRVVFVLFILEILTDTKIHERKYSYLKIFYRLRMENIIFFKGGGNQASTITLLPICNYVVFIFLVQ